MTTTKTTPPRRAAAPESPEFRAAVERAVAAAPRFSAGQLERIGAILDGAHAPAAEPAGVAS